MLGTALGEEELGVQVGFVVGWVGILVGAIDG